MSRSVTSEPGVLRTQSTYLVISCGNCLRSDDGAGHVLAEALVAQWRTRGTAVQHVAVQQLVPELALQTADDQYQAAIFVDTAAAWDMPEIQACRVAVDQTSPSLGHQTIPETLLLYASPAWSVTISGIDFAHGTIFSAQVSQLLTTASHLSKQIEQQVFCPSSGGLLINQLVSP